MRRASRVWTVGGLATAFVALVVVGAPAQQRTDSTRKKTDRKADTTAERASGVIVKVEPVTKGATTGSTIDKESKAGREQPRTLRLTINTAAVWRDWARDQATSTASESPRKAAETGAKSVAKGEPETKETLVVVDVGPDSKIETRFRTPTDESSKGATTPGAAKNPDTGSRPDDQAGAPKSSSSGKPAQYAASDLKPGLFVEVDFRHMRAQNVASTLAVIRPVGGSSK